MMMSYVLAPAPLLAVAPTRTRALLEMLVLLGPCEAGILYTAIQNIYTARHHGCGCSIPDVIAVVPDYCPRPAKECRCPGVQKVKEA
jgi:hypothetical protein